MEIKKIEKKDFPKALLEIPQPPEDLWIIGNLPKENLVCLSVVGSRKFTSYGKEACEKIIAGLKGYPIAIVSGFAMGIDTIAHKKAIEVGLKTIIFPGSGLSEKAIYPRTNARAVNEIIKNEGCLISEFEPDFRATKWSFPRRNRLMAGMSKAVLIIEAEERSGTLITARLATEYNRDVLVVPGAIFSPNSKGVNYLLRQGAIPVTNSEEVLEALGFEKEINTEMEREKLKDLSKKEKQVLELLREPMARDELTHILKMSIQEANSLFSIMEIKKLIKEELGKLRRF